MESTSTPRRSTYRARGSTGGYARRGSTRKPGASDKKEGDGFREKLLMQCIVSGIMFSIILAVTLIDTEFTNNIRMRLKSALSENVVFEDIKDKAANIPGYFVYFEDVVNTIFGYDREETTNEQNEEETTQQSEVLENNEEDSFRIDEDILNTMNSEEDIYAKNAKKP